MAARYANFPTTARGMNCAFLAAQMVLIMAIFAASAQEYLDSNELPQYTQNNQITPSVDSARSTRYGTRRNALRTNENCKNSVECANDEWTFPQPRVTYPDAYRFRAQQCSEFDKKLYNGKSIKWLPYLRAHLDECKLYCLASGHKFYAKLKNHVENGTPCGKIYSKVCIEGKCQKRPSGCQSLDGPCLVDERKKILGVFNSTQLNIGYNLVATIPAGATNITIEELSRSRSYLALKDHNSGTYHLNGHWMISLSKTFKMATSHVTYTRNGNTRHGGEVITINGPLGNSLDIMLIYQRDPSIITYSYLVTKDDYQKIKRKSRVAGEILYFPNTQKSVQPTEQAQNGGQASLQRSSQEGESITFRGGEGQTSLPNNGGQSRASRPGAGRNTDEGESISFPAGQRQTGNAGSHRQGFSYPHLSTGRRQVYNREQTDRDEQASSHGSSWVQFGGETGQDKQPSRSSTQLAERPILKQQVYKPKRTSVPWRSANSENRGRTWQNQDAKKQFYTSGQEQNDGVQRGYTWKMFGFTACSSSCAGGIQSRIVKCTRAVTGEAAASNRCDPRTRPQETRRACNLQPCPASWVTQEWQACSKTCGKGEQVRDLMCKQTIDRNGEKITVMLPVVRCPTRSRPSVIRECEVRECPEQSRPKWIANDWGQCSVDCGHGVRRRTIACKNSRNETVDDSQCLWMRKPVLMKSCYLGLCRGEWYHRPEWSQCSRTCGGGLRGRPVVCARIDGGKFKEKHCVGKTKPAHEQNCNTQRCRGIWVASEWSECTTDCGKGLQLRIVLCMKPANGNYLVTSDADCSLDDKPAVRKECSRECGPTWFSTAWTKCSVSCGSGVETRRASCLNGEGNRVGGCKAWERPQLRRTCNLRACPGSRPVKSSVTSTCKDNPPRRFKRYCHIIKRINYCRIASYRRRCCETCATSPTILGRHI
ncbi:thrombospondin type-1 domain-containing protein 4-like isoform X2 [Dendronephthya gigantea]|uniref:thrombospondin type-1 domain-containing protein 4-like isoform X2 n=1 Tax=Dendronephthya gigantea TaxID=151771 RepID=UPI00106A310F|nr:thrombospondin type-1 domain-containing protein 4-like isoform X2 [Dendronephthya gigantea]